MSSTLRESKNEAKNEWQPTIYRNPNLAQNQEKVQEMKREKLIDALSYLEWLQHCERGGSALFSI